MRYLKAQSILEYVTILGVVMMALLAMQVYMKRGIQAVVKVASDELGNQSYQTQGQKVSVTDSLSSSSTNQKITKTQTGKAFRRDIDMTTTMSGNTTFFETEIGIEPPGNP